MCRGTTASHALASGFWVHRQTDRHVLTVLVHALDATRHHRKQEVLYAFPCCSTRAQRLTASQNPAVAGSQRRRIRRPGTQRLTASENPAGLVDPALGRREVVLNALRHQRIQQSSPQTPSYDRVPDRRNQAPPMKRPETRSGPTIPLWKPAWPFACAPFKHPSALADGRKPNPATG